MTNQNGMGEMEQPRSQGFKVVPVRYDAALSSEPLGSKEKFWYEDKVLGLCLFKKSRPDTGEDWAEKVASELAELLGLPHALYELAICDGKERGTVCPTILPRQTLDSVSQLILGNQILGKLVDGYDDPSPAGERRSYRQPEHTLERVLRILDVSSDLDLPPQWKPPENVVKAADLFTGYLLLDAWIANVDRHHENWGFIETLHLKEKAVALHLAPTYDHASSLGRELTDIEREQRLNTKDKRFTVDRYLARAQSAFFHEGKSMHVRDAFQMCAEKNTDAARVWLRRLGSVSKGEVWKILQRVPDERMSPVAREFAWTMLDLNRSALLDMSEELQ